jgi:6-phosphogluconolactonase
VITFDATVPLSCSEPGMSHIHEVTFSGDRSVLVNDLGKDLVYRFEIAPDGSLSPVPTQTTKISTPGSGPRHTAIHPSAPLAFVINELSNTISSFTFDPLTGSLGREIVTVSTLRETEESAEMGAAEIQISADGRYLYGSNRDLSSPNLNRSSIVVMEIDSTNGTLTTIQHVDTLGEHPRHFDLFLGGSMLVVGNLKSNSIVSFPVDKATGLLGNALSQASAGAPTHVLSSRGSRVLGGR